MNIDIDIESVLDALNGINFEFISNASSHSSEWLTYDFVKNLFDESDRQKEFFESLINSVENYTGELKYISDIPFEEPVPYAGSANHDSFNVGGHENGKIDTPVEKGTYSSRA